MSNFPEERLQAYLDGQLSPAETAELSSALRQSPELQKQLLILSGFEEGLTAAFQNEAANPQTPTRTLAWIHFAWRPLAAAAALVACVGGVNLWQARQAEKAVVATLVEARGKCSVFSVQGSGSPESGVRSPTTLRPGTTIKPGTRLSLGSDGYAKLAYADGTLVELQQNTAMTLDAGKGTRLFGLVKELRGKRIQLDTGTLSARVAKQKIGEAMALATPHATATVLGTMLQLDVTTNSSLLSVQTGQVAFATATQQEIVSAGESARVQDGVLRKVVEPPAPPAVAGSASEDGTILFQDSFTEGFGKWHLYTKQNGSMQPTTTQTCPDIRIVKVERGGKSVPVAELVGKAPAGPRVGMVTETVKTKADAYIFAFEYTYDGPLRRAMEGLEIGMQCRVRPQARPPGEWNQVRWECTRATDAQGQPCISAKLYFNSELIGETAFLSSGEGVDVMLEVIEGQFRFANVAIRERKR
jgi:ferric-dicitrate binding protein FerR (iron transport regulator)